MSIRPSGRIAAALIPGAMAFATPALAANSIHGDWITQDRDAIVKISKCGSTVCGRIY